MHEAIKKFARKNLTSGAYPKKVILSLKMLKLVISPLYRITSIQEAYQ
jgi:hypothetical protein